MKKHFVKIGELCLKQGDIFSYKSVSKNIWNNGQIIQLKKLEKQQTKEPGGNNKEKCRQLYEERERNREDLITVLLDEALDGKATGETNHQRDSKDEMRKRRIRKGK